MNRQRSIGLLVVCVAALLSGCDSDNPVAPTNGTVLTLSATPTTITLNQTSQLVVTGVRSDGNPLNEGIRLRLSTNLGMLSEEVVVTDENGRATATLRPKDGKTGIASVTVVLDDSGSSASSRVEVQITAAPQPPAFKKDFSPDSITAGKISTLIFTIDNTANSETTTALAFTDNLPAGVVVAPMPNVNTSCTGGTVTAVAGSSMVSYTGGAVAAICTVSVDVISADDGLYINETEDLTSSRGNSGPAVNQLSVAPAPAPPPSQADGTYGSGTFSLTDTTCIPTFFGQAFDGTVRIFDNGTGLVITEFQARASTGSFTNGSGTFTGSGVVGSEPAKWLVDVTLNGEPPVAVVSELITLTARNCRGSFLSAPLTKQ